MPGNGKNRTNMSQAPIDYEANELPVKLPHQGNCRGSDGSAVSHKTRGSNPSWSQLYFSFRPPKFIFRFALHRVVLSALDQRNDNFEAFSSLGSCSSIIWVGKSFDRHLKVKIFQTTHAMHGADDITSLNFLS